MRSLRSTTRTILATAFLGVLTSACAATATTAPIDEPTADDSAATADGKADALASVSTYYTFRRDVRKCASPFCGGWYAEKANSTAADKYVAQIDWSALGLSDDEASALNGAGDELVVARGSIVKQTIAGNKNQSVFVATEAWRANSDAAPSGNFYQVTDAGVRCFTTPCFSMHEAKLNTTYAIQISNLDMGDDATTAAAQAAMHGDDGTHPILVAGLTYYVPHAGPAGTGKELDGTQFYVQVVHHEKICGGIAGFQCAPGYVCDITIQNACNGADLGGACVIRPQLCYQLVKPVCGCDGQTYINDCYRLQAGVQIDHQGSCN